LLPRFPEFRPINLSDRPFVQDALWKYQPDTSELTFTNLFIWRTHYGTLLSVYQEWLLIVFTMTSSFNLKEAAIETSEGMRSCQDYGRVFGEKAVK